MPDLEIFQIEEVRLRKIQNKIHYTNISEFIIGIMFTALITLAPNNIRGGLYKVLRKKKYSL